MNEIEKLYENAGIEKKPQFYCDYDYGATCPNDNATCDNCGYYEESEAKYPDFTAEKQLFLFKWVCKKFNEIYISYTDFGEVKNWEIIYKIGVHRNSFEECLCAFINLFWQDLTADEHQQVKGILE